MTFLSGYNKRKAIKYGTVLPSSSLSDFPKLFSITADSDINSELSTANGVAFTSADGTTTVPFGLYPSSNAASGTLLCRVKFPSLSSVASPGDTFGYLYYDHTQATSESKTSVMDGHFGGFLSMEEDPSGSAPQMYNWVSGANVGTTYGSMTSGQLVAGKVGSATSFDGSNDVIQIDPIASSIGSGSFTLSTIVKTTAPTVGQDLLGLNDAPSDNDVHFYITSTRFTANGAGVASQKFLLAKLDGATFSTVAGTTTIISNTFYHVVGRLDSSAGIAIFVNGSSEATNASGTRGSTASVNCQLGSSQLGSAGARDPFNGVMDEFHISNVARSNAWIAYDYQDAFNNSDTFSLGIEETDTPPSGTEGWSSGSLVGAGAGGEGWGVSSI